MAGRSLTVFLRTFNFHDFLALNMFSFPFVYLPSPTNHLEMHFYQTVVRPDDLYDIDLLVVLRLPSDWEHG